MSASDGPVADPTEPTEAPSVEFAVRCANGNVSPSMGACPVEHAALIAETWDLGNPSHPDCGPHVVVHRTIGFWEAS